MNELLEEKQIVAFLEGDSSIISHLGQIYLKVMGQNPIPKHAMADFLKGSPHYLAPIGEGWGMSTDDAVRCLFDINRTRIFIKGIAKAVKELKKHNGGISALEAGCGTGILAVAMVFAGVDKVNAIEINPVTAKYTDMFVHKLGLKDRIEVVNSDATTFTPNTAIDILTSENMHTGLFFEPQMQIISHFIPYMSAGSIILPESVSLSFALAKAHWDKIDKKHTELRKVNSLVDRVSDWGILPTINFRDCNADNPINGILPINGKAANALIVEMDIQIYPGLNLKSGQAEFLGQPHVIQISSLAQTGTYGFLHYQPGGSPPEKINIFYSK